MTSWRKEWFDYVRAVRKKETRKTKKECTHKNAMNIASQTWANYKIKLQRKYARQKKKSIPIENEPVLDNKNLTTK
jgi:hypothetical protein